MYWDLLLIIPIVVLSSSTFSLTTNIIIFPVLVILCLLHTILSQNWIFNLEELRPNYPLPWYSITLPEFVVYKLKLGIHNLTQRLFDIGWERYIERIQLPQSLVDNPSTWQLMLYMMRVMVETLLWEQTMMLCNLLDLMRKLLQALLLHLRDSHLRLPQPQG